MQQPTSPANTSQQPKLLDEVRYAVRVKHYSKRTEKFPEIFTRSEAQAVLSHFEGIYWLAGMLMYGAGHRLIKVLRLRVKDMYFNYKKSWKG